MLAERGSGGRGKTSMKYSTFHHRLPAVANVYQLEEPDNEMHSPGIYFADTYAKPRFSTRPSSYGSPRGSRSGLRPSNRIKEKLPPSHIAELKKHTKCNHCHKQGQWREECPDRRKTLVTEFFRVRIKELCSDDNTAATVLWEVVQQEEEYMRMYILLLHLLPFQNNQQNL